MLERSMMWIVFVIACLFISGCVVSLHKRMIPKKVEYMVITKREKVCTKCKEVTVDEEEFGPLTFKDAEAF